MEPEYIIKRSERRKKLTITVERDRTIVVHAPVSATDETIRGVVEEKSTGSMRRYITNRNMMIFPIPPAKNW